MDRLKKVNFPKSRLATIDAGKLGNSKHHITGLLEIDITDAREKVKTESKLEIEKRDILHSVDGAPAARFTRSLVKNIESARGL